MRENFVKPIIFYDFSTIEGAATPRKTVVYGRDALSREITRKWPCCSRSRGIDVKDVVNYFDTCIHDIAKKLSLCR